MSLLWKRSDDEGNNLYKSLWVTQNAGFSTAADVMTTGLRSHVLWESKYVVNRAALGRFWNHRFSLI